MTRTIVFNGLDLKPGRKILLLAPEILDGDELEQVSTGLKQAFPEIKFYILGGGFEAIAIDDSTITGEIDG